MPAALYRPSPAPDWDASIDLTPANIDARKAVSEQVVDEVRAAVSVLPGARHVSVEIHTSAPRHLRWLSVYRSGSAELPKGPEWDDVRCEVKAAVRGVTGVAA